MVLEEQKNLRRSRRKRRVRARQGVLLALLLLGVIACLLLGSLISHDRAYSESENRKLAQKPDFTWSALADGSYFSGWEDYLADQFVGRDFWISLRLRFLRLAGQREVNGVYLCDDGYLMEPPAEPDAVHTARNLEAVNDFAARHDDLSMYMAVIPNAAAVLADKLPENAPVRDQRADLQALADGLRGVTFLNVTQALTAHQDEQLYYRTDHHWTSLGARYAFEAMAPALGIAQPASAYQIYPVSTSFEGTLASRSGCHDAADTIELYVPENNPAYYVSYEDTKTNSSSLYVRDCLDKKDQYTVFFGGNYPRVDIYSTAETGRRLLLFKDSYANCFVQFLTPYYEHIILIDPRYYYGDAETLLRSEKVTDVLFLYNANTYFEDTSLADVLAAS